jgi:hypothetical protein
MPEGLWSAAPLTIVVLYEAMEHAGQGCPLLLEERMMSFFRIFFEGIAFTLGFFVSVFMVNMTARLLA